MDLGFAVAGFVQQAANFNAGRPAVFEVLHQIIQGQPRVYNILHNHDVAAFNAFAQVQHGAHLARGRSAPGVRRQAHKIHVAIYADVFHQIGIEQNAPAQNTHKQGLFAAVIGRDLAAKFGGAFG